MATLPPSEPATPGWVARLVAWGQWLSRPHPALTEVGARRQAQLLMVFAVAVTVTGLGGLGATLWQAGTRPALWSQAWLAGLGLIAYGVAHTRRPQGGAVLLLVGMVVSAYGLVLVGTSEPSMALFAILPLALVLGSVLLSLPGLIIFALGLVIAVVLLPLLAPAYSMAAAGRDSGLLWALGVAIVIVAAFRGRLEQARLQELQAVNRELSAVQATLEQRVVERTRNAETARAETEAANQTLAAQMWLVTGQAQLSDVLRGEQALTPLADNIIRQLCHYLKIPVGALYLYEEGTLRLVGRYAYAPLPGQPERFRPGEGLVGQSAQEQQLLLVSDIPAAQFAVASGLGETPPRHLLVAPFLYTGQVSGVVELGALAAFTPAQVQFVEQSLPAIAVAFNTAQNRVRINTLLDELQQQATELQAQEEKLQAFNAELQAQAGNWREHQQRPSPEV